MSEVVDILGNIIKETSTQEEGEETEEVKEPAEETELPGKQGNNCNKKGFDFKEMVSFTNKSIGKLDWRNWTPAVIRTW